VKALSNVSKRPHHELSYDVLSYTNTVSRRDNQSILAFQGITPLLARLIMILTICLMKKSAMRKFNTRSLCMLGDHWMNRRHIFGWVWRKEHRS
jgi:hypothetical protein